MARPQSVPGGRPNIISTRYSDEELEQIDALRRSLSRSEYLRLIVTRFLKGAKT